MTDELAEYHELVAIRALLEQRPDLVGRVGIGSAIVPGHEGEDDPPFLEPPYAVIYGDGDNETQVALTGSAEWNREPAFIVHGVGSSVLAARAVLGWVDQLLRPNGVGVTPVVPGRSTGRIRRTERPGDAMDDDAKPPVWSAIAVYRFGSRRTTPNP